MTTIAAPGTTTRRSSVPARVGVVLAALQGVGCLVLNVPQIADSAGIGLVFTIVGLVAGVAALALAVPIWRGARWAAVVVGGLLLLQSLGGVFAFVTPGVPTGLVIAAAAGIVLAVVTLALLLVPARR